MTLRYSNTAFMTVLDPIPLDGIGWYVRVLSERDYSSTILLIDRFVGLGFTLEDNAEGGAKLTLDAQDRYFTDAPPAGEGYKFHEQEALFQIIEDGIIRAEFLGEDLLMDVITESGELTTEITGRGTATVLDWAKVLPAGMPTPASMERVWTLHPMAVWHALFLEAQAAGFLTWVTPLFDGTYDSTGGAWGAVQEVKVQAGESLLELLKRFCDANDLLWRMLPGFKLQVRPNTTRRMEDKIVFTQYRGQSAHTLAQTRREIANVVYASSGDTGIAISEDTTSQTRYRKRMAWMSAGGAGDATARSAVANATLGLRKDAKASRSVTVDPLAQGRRLFVDYGLSDWIGIEEEAETGATPRQIVAVAVDIDKDANVQAELTLQTRFEARAVKQQRMLDALGGSESDGAGAAPIPVSSAMATTMLEDLSNVDTAGKANGDVLVWNSGSGKWVDGAANLNFLTDVDLTVAPTAGQALVYNAVAGQWKAATVSGGGGGAVAQKHLFPVPFLSTSINTARMVVGQRVMAMADCTVQLSSFWITGVAGKTYRFGCWEMNNNTYVAQVGSYVDTASPGTGRQKVTSPAVTWALTAGKVYLFTLHCTDSSTITMYAAGTTAAGSPGLYAMVPPASDGQRYGTVLPAVSGTVTAQTGSTETEFMITMP